MKEFDILYYKFIISLLSVGGKYHVQLGSFSDLRNYYGGNPGTKQHHVNVKCRTAGIQKIASVQSGHLGRLFNRYDGLHIFLQYLVSRHSQD